MLGRLSCRWDPYDCVQWVSSQQGGILFLCPKTLCNNTKLMSSTQSIARRAFYLLINVDDAFLDFIRTSQKWLKWFQTNKDVQKHTWVRSQKGGICHPIPNIGLTGKMYGLVNKNILWPSIIYFCCTRLQLESWWHRVLTLQHDQMGNFLKTCLPWLAGNRVYWTQILNELTYQAVHCSSLQVVCGDLLGCTPGKPVETLALEPVLVCLGSLTRVHVTTTKISDFMHMPP